MKRIIIIAIMTAIIATFTGCNHSNEASVFEGAIQIELSDAGIKADGESIGTNTDAAVYIANDIVYYEAGHDFTYGEGSESDAHTEEEAFAHTVVHISESGTYCLTGELSKGQIAIDLGEDAEDDPEAVVTLILNDVDITCEVAPAIIFYNVYECGNADEEEATYEVDTSAAGANVLIADGTSNTVNGSYVARIYKPDSVELNDAGTEVEDAKKLHKYDAAFYSKMSMNISGDNQGTGILNINAENEGLDSEMHLTINGGNININSGNDGINTNEDGISVTTINGGVLRIIVTGDTGEGDGIDSNGWLVINDGTVMAEACSDSADAGIDSDMGIYINGGTVMATGHMLDHIEDGGQTYAVFQFAQAYDGADTIYLKDASGETVMEYAPENRYSVLIFSSFHLKEGTYTLWSGETPLAGQSMIGMQGGPGGGMNSGGRPEMPEGLSPGEMMPPDFPENGDFGEMPEAPEFPENFEMPEGIQPPMNHPNQFSTNSGELSTDFKTIEGANMFGNITEAE
ncbi:MAG: carbohydrate-binding domain-containing protein [Lachnospiraceae bacterium]|nr:carbohydrate-binding domain-containing protein [Lachnospiraceae bacterium]